MPNSNVDLAAERVQSGISLRLAEVNEGTGLEAHGLPRLPPPLARALPPPRANKGT